MYKKQREIDIWHGMGMGGRGEKKMGAGKKLQAQYERNSSSMAGGLETLWSQEPLSIQMTAWLATTD